MTMVGITTSYLGIMTNLYLQKRRHVSNDKNFHHYSIVMKENRKWARYGFLIGSISYLILSNFNKQLIFHVRNAMTSLPLLR